MPERYRSIVDVHVILPRRENPAHRRQNTGYCDGMLRLPSGHLEEGEPLHQGAARELREEVGITVDPDTPRLATIVHHYRRPGRARLGAFFVATHWEGEPVNAEPHKCGPLVWADPHHLPENTIDYPAQGIRAWLEGHGYVPHNWERLPTAR